MCRRILVVVQCHSLADRIALRLERLGHQVRIACDGQAALVIAGNLHPDVVLLDATMANVSGCQVAVALRRVLGGQDIPIVTISPSVGTHLIDSQGVLSRKPSRRS